MISVDRLPLDHLRALTDQRGVFEHAEYAVPRLEHGYCLDDAARALVVAVREHDRAAEVAALLEVYLGFVENAIGPDGRAHNRLDALGRWTDEPGVGDWWGRAVLALGFTAARAVDSSVRRRASDAFDRAAQQRSPHLRAMASAAIGAAELLDARPESEAGRRLLLDAVDRMPEPGRHEWAWPEARLSYGNAALPEALLAAGAVLEDARLTLRGISALSFLVRVETRHGHLSVTGVGGRGPSERGAQFDQQPIEVAAIADAAARAAHLGLGDHWASTVRLCWSWFLGDNDAGVAMFDRDTGAGFDGLHAAGRNGNRGAESTLAALSTSQQVRALDSIHAP